MRTSLATLGLLILLSAQAQLSINWHTIGGGGGTSTGRVYSVGATTNPIVIPATLPAKFYRLLLNP